MSELDASSAVTAAHVSRNRTAYDAQSTDLAAEAAFASDQRTKVAYIKQLIATLTPRARFAEVGAFTGYAAAQYATVPGVETASCFDLSPSAVERCRARGLAAHVWNADTERCPVPDGSFDVVVAADVVEHLLDTEHFLRELHRVTDTSGWLILSTPNLTFWLNRVRMLLGRVPWSYPGVSSRTRVDSAIDLNHLRINTGAEWSNLLHECGWSVARRGTYSLLDDQPPTLRNRILLAVDRVARRNPELAFGHIFVARRG